MSRHILIMTAVLSAACASAPQFRRWPAYTDARFSTAGAYIQVVGVGKPDMSLTNETQRKSTSRDAAILDARARLQAYLEKIYIPGKGIVGELAAVDKSWKSRLDAALSAIEPAGTTWESDGTAAVVLRADRRAMAGSLDLEQ